MRINIFENINVFHRLDQLLITNDDAQGRIFVAQGVYIPGSISFNNIALALSGSPVALTETISLSFGLYSLNNATLSIANSASNSFTFGATFRSWITLITSATQDITPGNWYFGFNFSGISANIAKFAPIGYQMGLADGTYLGPFVQGVFSVTTGGLPASIATSAFFKNGDINAGALGNSVGSVPYIIIAA